MFKTTMKPIFLLAPDDLDGGGDRFADTGADISGFDSIKSDPSTKSTGADPAAAAETTPDEPAREEPETPEGEPAAPEDPEVEVLGSKYKKSELEALIAKGRDYTTKTQTAAQEREALARERQEFEVQKKLADAGVRELLKNPAKYAQMQREAGVVPDGPDPITDPQGWADKRYREYLAAGHKPEDITRSVLVGDLTLAQNKAMHEQMQQMQRAAAEANERANQNMLARQVEQKLDSLYKLPQYSFAASAEGRDLVDSLLAAAVQRGEDPDLETVVQKVQNIAARLTKQYVDKKQGDARATRGVQRGGGGHPAPKPDNYGTGFDGFDEIAKKRSR